MSLVLQAADAPGHPLEAVFASRETRETPNPGIPAMPYSSPKNQRVSFVKMQGTTRLINSSERTTSYRPRISRETRHLLITSLIALLALWALARVRFPDRPVTPNPVPPLLSQIATGARFSDLASVVGDLRGRLDPLLALVPADLTRTSTRPGERVAALRIRDDLAVALLPPDMRSGERDPFGVIARDPVSGLTIVRVPGQTRANVPPVWASADLDQPRYLIASSPSPASVSLRPAFIGSLTPVDAPEWRGTVWALPPDSTIPPGTFLFTEDVELVGVAAQYGTGAAIVPGGALLAAADALTKAPPARPGEIGIEVQPLTSSLSIASGAETGVMVAWVDPQGAAANMIVAGDVIEAVDGTVVPTPEHWAVYAARLQAGDTIELSIVRHGGAKKVALTAAEPRGIQDAPPLGLTLRSVPRVGVEVIAVAPASLAVSSGIEPGDLITMIEGINAPSPAQVRSAYASATRGQLLMVALVRGLHHRIVTLQR